MIQDHQQYDSGKLKWEVACYYLGKTVQWTHMSAFYENGRLQSDEWTDAFDRLVKLAFYENGRLKSEERFTNGQLTFGAYYTDTGELERTVGDRLAEGLQ
jgi:antitoxin component YwqK of YwqJK toxin-antitoxin module